MRRKHAIVIALSFVLVGMMFFSVDTPLIIERQEASQNIASPQDEVQIAAEVDSMGNLRTNVIENPSFEDWTGGAPDGYTSIRESGYTDVDYAYAGAGVTGNYAALLEVQGSPTDSTGGQFWVIIPSSPNPLVTPGISFSLDWNALANPDMFQGSFVEIRVYITNPTSDNRFINYILSHDTYSPTNNANNAYFSMNDSLNQWNPFAVNLTEDYIDGFGAGDLTSTHYVSSVSFAAFSPTGATGLLQVAFDNVVLTNGSYSAWIGNGDFETGVASPWIHTVSDRAYVEQSMDSTHGSSSLKMSIPDVTSGAGYAILTETFDYPGGYLASSMGETVLELDWKYNDTSSAGQQSSYILLRFRNQTAFYDMYLYIGTDNDILPGSNSTNTKFFKIPGFGVRTTWQHLSLDIYEYMTYAEYTDTSLYEIRLYVENRAIGATVDALFDDLRLVTYPLGDPGFEADWYMDSMTPFAGWRQYVGDTTEIKRTTDSYLGNYACNLTAVSLASAGIYRDAYIPLHPSDLTNFSWRLDEMASSTAYATIRIRFDDSNYFDYVLGAGSDFSLTNTSGAYKIVPSLFNNTGSWNHLVVNVTANYEEAFGSSSGVFIDRVILRIYSPISQRVSILFDEMHFIDGAPPVVDSVAFLPVTPMYYESVDVTIYAHDRSGIQTVYVDYYNGSWWGLPATDMGGYYFATIPAHSYGTTVEFEVSVTDGSGYVTLDNNGGSRYSYTVGDDIDPTLTISNPANNTDQEGLLAITATVDGTGSGVDYVTFNPDGSGPVDDYTAPYSQNWNLDDASLGSHFIVVSVHDIAGNSVTKTHYITVVDTVNPVLAAHNDVEFTVGETGNIIDWAPTDNRPGFYDVFVDTISTYSGLWNSSSEHIVIDLDALAVGTYNFTCVVYDDAGNSAVDTIIVTVNEEVTTTTTTDTTTTDTTTTTTGGPTGGGDIMTPLLIVAGIGVVGILLIVFVVLPKMKKT